MQKLGRTFLFLLWLVGLTACGGDARLEPTPFPTAVPTFRASTDEPIPVPITDLAANPSFYNNAYIQLSGAFDRLPRLVCGGRTYRSPANWGVVNNDFLARAAGFEDQLFSLATPGLTMTVAGYWREWRGPIGCGKSAVPSTIWYLEVNEILAPSPLVKATLTPVGAGPVAQVTPGAETPDSIVPTATPDPDDIGDGSSGDDGETAVNTPTPSRTATPATSTQATITPTAPTSGTASSGTATPTSSPAANTTPANGTTTPTPTTAASPTTGSGGTAPTPTTSGSSRPTNTPASSATIEVNQGSTDVGGEVFAIERLLSGEYHLWTFELIDAAWVSIYVMAEPTMDIRVTLLDASGTTLIARNSAPAGQLESIIEFPISSEGLYQLRIETVNAGGVGYYAFTVQDDFSFPAIPQGNLTANNPRTANLPELTDNYWSFTAAAGSQVTITTQSSNGDIFFYVYDPAGNELVYAFDEDFSGSTTTTLSITTTGLYVIYLGEQDFAAADYTITLTGN